MTRRVPRLALLLVLSAQALAWTSSASADPVPFRVPHGYTVVTRTRLANGVDYVRLQSSNPLHVVEVGIVRRGAAFHAEVHHAPRLGGVERTLRGTSRLCGHCVLATNGDYAERQVDRTIGHPIGGIVENGIVLVSPNPRHHQASYTYDGGFTTERLTWSAELGWQDLALPVTAKNTVRGPNDLVLYTPDYLRTTGTNRHGAELTLQLDGGDLSHRPGTRLFARLVGFRYGVGNAAVKPGTVVLSGHGGAAGRLLKLWRAAGKGAEVGLTESLSPGNIWSSVGGGHILVRNGKRWLQPENAAHLTTTHPRTFAGVTKSGNLFQATVDGRDRSAGRSVGMPLEEALRFFLAFGAREVINLDGGGSTTFVVGGRIYNLPSDGTERPVTTAIAVMPGGIPQPPVERTVFEPIWHYDADPPYRAQEDSGRTPPPPPQHWPQVAAGLNIGVLIAGQAFLRRKRDRGITSDRRG